MDAFLSWFFAFMTTILGAIWSGISGLFKGLVQIFNFPAYFDQLSRYKGEFNFLGWVLCVLTFLLTYGIVAAIIFLPKILHALGVL